MITVEQLIEQLKAMDPKLPVIMDDTEDDVGCGGVEPDEIEVFSGKDQKNHPVKVARIRHGKWDL